MKVYTPAPNLPVGISVVDPAILDDPRMMEHREHLGIMQGVV